MKVFITGHYEYNDFAVMNAELSALAYVHEEQFDGEPMTVVVPAALKNRKWITFPGASSLALELAKKRGFTTLEVSLPWDKDKKQWDVSLLDKLLGPNDRVLFVDPELGKSKASATFPLVPGTRVCQQGSLRDKPAHDVTEQYLKEKGMVA